MKTEMNTYEVLSIFMLCLSMVYLLNIFFFIINEDWVVGQPTLSGKIFKCN